MKPCEVGRLLGENPRRRSAIGVEWRMLAIRLPSSSAHLSGWSRDHRRDLKRSDDWLLIIGNPTVALRVSCLAAMLSSHLKQPRLAARLQWLWRFVNDDQSKRWIIESEFSFYVEWLARTILNYRRVYWETSWTDRFPDESRPSPDDLRSAALKLLQ